MLALISPQQRMDVFNEILRHSSKNNISIRSSIPYEILDKLIKKWSHSDNLIYTIKKGNEEFSLSSFLGAKILYITFANNTCNKSVTFKLKRNVEVKDVTSWRPGELLTEIPEYKDIFEGLELSKNVGLKLLSKYHNFDLSVGDASTWFEVDLDSDYNNRKTSDEYINYLIKNNSFFNNLIWEISECFVVSEEFARDLLFNTSEISDKYEVIKSHEEVTCKNILNGGCIEIRLHFSEPTQLQSKFIGDDDKYLVYDYIDNMGLEAEIEKEFKSMFKGLVLSDSIGITIQTLNRDYVINKESEFMYTITI